MTRLPWIKKYLNGFLYYDLKINGVFISMEQRPHYCDRGNWIVKIIDPGPMSIDSSDLFPRYYFDFEIARCEVHSFLKKRGVI